MNLEKKDPNDRSHLGVIKDPNVKIKPGKLLRDYIQKSKFKFGSVLTLSDLQELYDEIKDQEGIYLNDLMVGSELVIPKLEIPERNPELEKRVNNLRNALNEKEYRRMTRNVNLTSRFNSEDSIRYQIKQMNSQLIGVFQFVVSVGAAFMFGFMGIDVLFGLTLELAVKLLLGIMCGLIVAGAELYFLAMNLSIAESDIPTLPPLKKPTAPKSVQVPLSTGPLNIPKLKTS